MKHRQCVRGSRFAALLAASAVLAVIVGGEGGASADAPQRTWNYLTTGNGHGFQVFDTNKHKIVSFLEHPYRYVRPSANPQSDGVGRRNLAFDFYFGLKGGGASGWLNAPTSSGDPEYVDQTNIIHAPVTLGSITADSYFFSPFGFEGNAIVALLKAPGASDGYVIFNFHMGTGQPDSPDSAGEALRAIGAQQAIAETGPGGGAMVYVPLSGVDHEDCVGVYNKGQAGLDLGDNQACSGNDIVPAFQKKLGADGWMAVAAVFVENPADADAAAKQIKDWAGTKTPEQILTAAKTDFEAWRKPPPAGAALCTDNEKKLWRQSETILRMGQVREPNTATRRNNGMMLASLPPGEWHTGWVRDATYAIVALARSGHFAEAKAALNFFLNAAPVGKYKSYVNNQSYRISVVRYFGTGEEEADFSGQPTPNVEIDGWGLVMWAARQYVDLSGDAAWLASATALGPTVYQSIHDGIAVPLQNNMETNGVARADSSIWEVHDANKRHYAYTTMAAARGFCDMAELAKVAGQPGDTGTFQGLSTKAKAGLLAAFVDPQGAIGGSIEGLSLNKYYDAAVAEAFTWNLLPDFTGDTAKATLTMLNNLRVDSGGFKRNNEGQSSYDENEWILVDLRIANALRRAGRGKEADGYVAQIIEKAAANFFLLPELYNAVAADGAIGKYTGSIPMVGYGGGAYIITMLDRSGIIEPNDCGDGRGTTLAVLKCEGIDTTPPSGGGGGGGGGGSGGDGGAGGSGGPNGANVPYGTAACLCEQAGSGGATSAFSLLLCLGPLAFFVRRARRR